ncbi:MAG TPA: CbiX/SirB N-terminal domain-containing protein [Mycobacteriales bacterium]|jgi:sirohydrochlorin cobaltochelatase|nr:CbiX/SirB N-terminal domain-containing protein [Mycobacteriales bacterium]
MEDSSAACPVGLLVVGHGSRRAEANDMLRSVAALVAERLPAYVVEPAFLELVRPTIADGWAALVAAGCASVVVHPYFLYPGNHTTTDIPAALAAAAQEHGALPWVLTEPLNLDPRIVDVVADRVATALEAP